MSSFTPAGSGGLVPSVSLAGAVKKNPAITEITVGPGETAVIIPINTTSFQLKCREKRAITIGTVSAGAVATLWPGSVLTESNINQPAGFTLYITASAALKVELLTWETA